MQGRVRPFGLPLVLGTDSACSRGQEKPLAELPIFAKGSPQALEGAREEVRAGHVPVGGVVQLPGQDCTCIISSVLQTILLNIASSYPHFTDAETEAQSFIPRSTAFDFTEPRSDPNPGAASLSCRKIYMGKSGGVQKEAPGRGALVGPLATCGR